MTAANSVLPVRSMGFSSKLQKIATKKQKIVNFTPNFGSPVPFFRQNQNFDENPILGTGRTEFAAENKNPLLSPQLRRIEEML